MQEELKDTSFPAAATIPAGDHKYTRSRSGEVEEKVHLLDPSSSSRGQGNSQGQVGCPDGLSSTGRLAEGECGTSSELETQDFFVDLGGALAWEPFGVYVRGSEIVLGQEAHPDPSTPDNGSSRCFNCGSPDHMVYACSLPLDHAVVSLSRQYFYFYQSLRGVVEFQRIHIVEEWRRQRLEWLDTFEPGAIRGPLLLDALEGGDGEWLSNMALWGYPSGWLSVNDPRERVRHLILSENASDEDDIGACGPFFIFGDDVHPETVEPSTGSGSEGYDTGDGESSDGGSTTISLSSDAPEPDDQSIRMSRRWAEYPSTYFSSHLLPVYNGIQLPPISHRGSSTYTPDRQELWHRLVSGSMPPRTIPPWRLPGAFGVLMNLACPISPPPPPSTTPPPLPPPPIADPPLSDLSAISAEGSNVYEIEELDMDLSD